MTTGGGSSSATVSARPAARCPTSRSSSCSGRLLSDEPEVADDLIAAHPSLGPLLQAHLRGPTAETSESHRGDLFESLHAGLEHLAATQPLLVVIEDVHWADQSSRELLSLLLTRGFLGPVSLVISFRSDDLHRRHPLRATLANWSRLAQVRRLDLGPLDRPAMRELVRGLDTGGQGRAASPTARSRRWSSGRRATRSSPRRSPPRACGARPASAPTCPDCCWSASSSSTPPRRPWSGSPRPQGGTSPTSCWPGSCRRPPAIDAAALDLALRDAVERHILVPTDTGYAFRHALLAETVYDDMLPGERVRAHATYARVIDADGALGKSADLARHAAEAGERALALRASVSAGGERDVDGRPRRGAPPLRAGARARARGARGGHRDRGDGRRRGDGRGPPDPRGGAAAGAARPRRAAGAAARRAAGGARPGRPDHRARHRRPRPHRGGADARPRRGRDQAPGPGAGRPRPGARRPAAQRGGGQVQPQGHRARRPARPARDHRRGRDLRGPHLRAQRRRGRPPRRRSSGSSRSPRPG